MILNWRDAVERFLMVRLGDGAGRTPVVVVEGFDRELRRAMGADR